MRITKAVIAAGARAICRMPDQYQKRSPLSPGTARSPWRTSRQVQTPRGLFKNVDKASEEFQVKKSTIYNWIKQQREGWSWVKS